MEVMILPSFAYEVKSELVNVVNANYCCDVSQLNAMLKISANIIGNRIDFINTNAAVARKVLMLVKEIYDGVKTEVAVIRNKKFRTTNKYVVRIFLSSGTKSLLQAMQSNKFPVDSCCQNAYLRGLFLACGSINRPESSYHFEIFTDSQSIARFVEKNLRKMEFTAHTFLRKDKFVVYVKESDVICDILYVMKAEKAVERFEIAQNRKEVRINVNRIINCETANLQRAVDAAQKQLRDIKAVYKLGLPLDYNLKEAAEIRLKNPDASIPELAEKLFISPSGFKHRMRKIHMLAKLEGNQCNSVKNSSKGKP